MLNTIWTLNWFIEQSLLKLNVWKKEYNWILGEETQVSEMQWEHITPLNSSWSQWFILSKGKKFPTADSTLETRIPGILEDYVLGEISTMRSLLYILLIWWMDNEIKIKLKTGLFYQKTKQCGNDLLMNYFKFNCDVKSHIFLTIFTMERCPFKHPTGCQRTSQQQWVRRSDTHYSWRFSLLFWVCKNMKDVHLMQCGQPFSHVSGFLITEKTLTKKAWIDVLLMTEIQYDFRIVKNEESLVNIWYLKKVSVWVMIWACIAKIKNRSPRFMAQ